MDKYKKLFSNTIIFGIGTFGSKALVFLLMPLYTRVLTNEDYGIVDLIVQSSNLLLPLVSVGIFGAIIRFGLDKAYDKTEVFSSGLLVILSGFCAFLLFVPLIWQIELISGYTLLIVLYVFTGCLKALCANFVRAKQYVRLYAFEGILGTVMVIVFNILFLLVFKLGVVGYVLSIILADFFSIIFLTLTARLTSYVNLFIIKKSTLFEMLKYSIPLIPNTVFWWVTNVSDRFIVTAMLGEAANGLYAVSYKVPTLISLVSGIFMEAWQMSAITDRSDPKLGAFFSKVFKSYQGIVFAAASFLILCSKLITKVLVSDAFYASWRFIPLLVMATTFSCFVTFMGSVYMVEKKSVTTLTTTALGAIVNISLNFALIPVMGVTGAAFATFISFFVVYTVRLFNTKKYIKINWHTPLVIFNLIILSAQTLFMMLEAKSWLFIEILLFLLIIIINIFALLSRKDKKA